MPTKTKPATERLNARQQARLHAQQQQRRQRQLLIGGISLVAVLVIIAISIAAIIVRVHQSTLADQAAQRVGTPVADEGRTHVPDGTAIQYQTYPPASGTHYPSPANAGYYPNPLPEGTFVHNLEHGYVVILYKPSVDTPTIQQLQAATQNFPKSKSGNIKLVVAPYEKMDTPITALAWDWRMPLATFDRDQLLQFYRAHVDRGPEDLA